MAECKVTEPRECGFISRWHHMSHW